MRASATVAVTALFAVAIGPAAPGRAANPGARAFQKCYACHSVDRAETGLPGPNLAGVMGRRAGTTREFEYTAAMKDAGARGLVWDRPALDRFLINPEGVVPGTSMARPHLESDQERRAVIDYLADHE